MTFEYNGITKRLDLVNISILPPGSVATLTGDSGGAVGPTGNNINLFGTAAQGVSTAGNPGTSTIIFTVQNASTAVKGVAQFNPVDFTVAAGVVSLSGTGVGTTITGNSGGPLSPTAGNWNIFGGTGITTSGAGSTLTINASGSVPITFNEDVGSATAVGGTLNIFGTAVQGISTSGAGNTITLTVADATTAQKGVTLLATNAGTIAGINTTTAVTPASLAAKLGTQTAHSLAVFEGTSSALTALGAATNGQLPIGSTGADPVLATLTAGTGVTVTNGAGSITIAASGGVATTYTEDSGTATPAANNLNIFGTAVQGISTSGAGSTVTITAATATTAQKGVVELATNAQAINGTDAANAVTSAALAAKLGTQTAHSLALFEGSTSALASLGVATSGQIPIGSTGADPVLATLTAGVGISITNGAGSITISAPATGLAYSDKSTNFNASVSNGYFCTAALTATLPASPSEGDTIEIICDTSGAVIVAANTGQMIRLSTAISAATGSATSSAQGDTMKLIYRAATTTWIVISTIGNWTIA